MQYKALFLDVDRTLIPAFNSLPSKKVREAVIKAKSRVHVCLATARPFPLVEHITDLLEIDDPCIVSGGSQIIDPKHKSYFLEYPLPHKTVLDICKMLSEQNLQFWIQDGGEDVKYSESYTPNKPFVIVVDSLEQKKATDFIHALSQFPGIITLRSSRYDKPNLIDLFISHANGTKQHGIVKVMEILNLKSEEIIGVGDSYNDYPLLLASGLKVAMGNAVDDLKAIADYVCPSVHQDGVADVIKKYILTSY